MAKAVNSNHLNTDDNYFYSPSKKCDESLQPPTPPRPLHWQPLRSSASTGKINDLHGDVPVMFTSGLAHNFSTYDTKLRNDIKYTVGDKSHKKSFGGNEARLSLDSYVKPKGVRVRLFDDCDIDNINNSPPIKLSDVDGYAKSELSTHTETSGVDSDFDDISSDHSKKISHRKIESDYSDSGTELKSARSSNSHKLVEPNESFISDLQRIRRRIIFDDASSIVSESVIADTDILQELLDALPKHISSDEYKEKLLNYIQCLANQEKKPAEVTAEYINKKLELLLHSVIYSDEQKLKPNSIIDHILKIDSKVENRDFPDQTFASELRRLQEDLQQFNCKGNNKDTHGSDEDLHVDIKSSFEPTLRPVTHDDRDDDVADESISNDHEPIHVPESVKHKPCKKNFAKMDKDDAEFHPLQEDNNSSNVSEVNGFEMDMAESELNAHPQGFRTLQIQRPLGLNGRDVQSSPMSDLQQITFDPSAEVLNPTSQHQSNLSELEQFQFENELHNETHDSSTEGVDSTLQPHHLAVSNQPKSRSPSNEAHSFHGDELVAAGGDTYSESEHVEADQYMESDPPRSQPSPRHNQAESPAESAAARLPPQAAVGAVGRWVLDVDPNPNPEDDQGPNVVIPAPVQPDAANVAPPALVAPAATAPAVAGLGAGGLSMDQQAAMFSEIIAKQMQALEQQRLQQQAAFQEQLRQLQQQAAAIQLKQAAAAASGKSPASAPEEKQAEKTSARDLHPPAVGAGQVPRAGGPVARERADGGEEPKTSSAFRKPPPGQPKTPAAPTGHTKISAIPRPVMIQNTCNSNNHVEGGSSKVDPNKIGPKPSLPAAATSSSATKSMRQMMAKDGLELSPIRSEADDAPRYLPSSPGGSSAYAGAVLDTNQNNRSMSSSVDELESDIASMEHVRQHLQDMVAAPLLDPKLAAAAGGHSTDLHDLHDRTVTPLLPESDTFLANFSSKYLSHLESGNRSSDTSCFPVHQTDWKMLRDVAESERHRRKHCEQAIHDLQAKILELQQQVAVSISTDRKKDNMILQLDKTLAKVVGGWKIKEAEIQDKVHELEEQNREYQEMEKLMKVQKRKLAEAVASLEETQTQHEQAQARMAEAEATSQRERQRLLEALKLERERVETLETDKQTLEQGRDKLLSKVKDMTEFHDEERENWEEKEREYLQKIDEITQNHLSADEKQKDQIAILSEKVRELQMEVNSGRVSSQKLEMELDAAVREKESMKVQMGLMEAKYESSQMKLESELSARWENELSSRLSEEASARSAAEAQLTERHKRQLGELSERHAAEVRRLRAELTADMEAREARWTDAEKHMLARQRELERRLEQETAARAAVEEQRHALAARLQLMMQEHCSEALRLLTTGASAETGSQRQSNQPQYAPVSSHQYNTASSQQQQPYHHPVTSQAYKPLSPQHPRSEAEDPNLSMMSGISGISQITTETAASIPFSQFQQQQDDVYSKAKAELAGLSQQYRHQPHGDTHGDTLPFKLQPKRFHAEEDEPATGDTSGDTVVSSSTARRQQQQQAKPGRSGGGTSVVPVSQTQQQKQRSPPAPVGPPKMIWAASTDHGHLTLDELSDGQTNYLNLRLTPSPTPLPPKASTATPQQTTSILLAEPVQLDGFTASARISYGTKHSPKRSSPKKKKSPAAAECRYAPRSSHDSSGRRVPCDQANTSQNCSGSSGHSGGGQRLAAIESARHDYSLLSDGPEETRQQELQAYIKMLLQKPPGSPVDDVPVQDRARPLNTSNNSNNSPASEVVRGRPVVSKEIVTPPTAESFRERAGLSPRQMSEISYILERYRGSQEVGPESDPPVDALLSYLRQLEPQPGNHEQTEGRRESPRPTKDVSTTSRTKQRSQSAVSKERSKGSSGGGTKQVVVKVPTPSLEGAKTVHKAAAAPAGGVKPAATRSVGNIPAGAGGKQPVRKVVKPGKPPGKAVAKTGAWK